MPFWVFFATLALLPLVALDSRIECLYCCLLLVQILATPSMTPTGTQGTKDLKTRFCAAFWQVDRRQKFIGFI